MIKCFVMGNLTKDPEMKISKNGNPVCSFPVASERKRKNADGTKSTEYFAVSCFGKLAETMGKYLTKGRRVIAIGEVSSYAYLGSDNQPKGGINMTADEVYFVGGRSDIESVDDSTVKASAPSAPDTYRKQEASIPAGFVEISEDELPFDFSEERR